ncbi:laccase domain-containing protein [Mycobacterium sp. NAZ190054]
MVLSARATMPAAAPTRPACTVEDQNLFSHRRDAPTGRMASVIWLEPAS